MHSGSLTAVCISPRTGTIKTAVELAEVDQQGIVGDAHAGTWHRQVSLMADEDVAPLAVELGRELPPGTFGENLRTHGIALADLSVGTCLAIGDVRLELTQVGKECHNSGCPIKRQTGRCVMPTRGVFCRVISGGGLRRGQAIEIC